MGWLYLGAYSAFALGLVVLALVVNSAVPEPYMDEIFHVPQAQAYCERRWEAWDPALTTPPGLYLVSVFLSKLVSHLPNPCSVPLLRATNLLLFLPLPHLYTSLLSHIRNPNQPRSSPKSRGKQTPAAVQRLRSREALHRAEGLVIGLFPVLGFFSCLYYTDVGSVVLVMESWRRGLDGRYGLSALAGAASLWFRQTNVIWVGWVVASCVLRELDRAGQTDDPLLARAESIDVPIAIFSLGYYAFNNVRLVLPIVAYYIPIFVGAVAFVVWNGGIVLGDKHNHVPVIHLPQFLYFLAFSASFLSPLLLSPTSLLRALRNCFGSPKRCVASLFALMAMWWSIMHYTVAHPFLLADNRHYAFYVWRRVLNPHPMARYALAVGYLVAARLIRDKLAQSQSLTLLPLLILTVLTFLSLVPTPLLEPRYFLVPYLILRLHFPPPSRKRLALEAVVYAAVMLGTVWVFVARPFRWEGRQDLMRFMW